MSKYELKDMSVKKYINEHCVIWNEFYLDYVTIAQAQDLLNLLPDNVSDRNRPKGENIN